MGSWITTSILYWHSFYYQKHPQHIKNLNLSFGLCGSDGLGGLICPERPNVGRIRQVRRGFGERVDSSIAASYLLINPPNYHYTGLQLSLWGLRAISFDHALAKYGLVYNIIFF